ncbi:hypothetical protein CXX93_08125 [Gordonia sp. YC-JH1]|nr:hypothetical protein CXX93_08125 [Gordonia sp. YC-JH1]
MAARLVAASFAFAEPFGAAAAAGTRLVAAVLLLVSRVAASLGCVPAAASLVAVRFVAEVPAAPVRRVADALA